MKKSMKAISLAGAAILAAGSLAGCGGGKSGNKTELKIGVFNGGLGYAWAEEVADAFEAKYADVSFEPGKVGVEVTIDPQKELFKVDAIKSSIVNNSGANDMYYTCYRFHRAFANEGIAYNLTDIVNEKVYLANGEMADMTYDPETKKYVLASGAEEPTMSLADKLNDTWKDAYYYDSNESITPGYYGLPYETSLSGFIYDRDLFVEKGWNNYDGIDGMPDTVEDFYDLLERIRNAGMIPYTWSPSDYWAGIQTAYMAQYEGFDNAALNYTYSGEYTFHDLPQTTLDVFTESFCEANAITNNGDGTYTVTITPSNAWLLAYQSGKDSYINFMRTVADPDYFDNNRYKSSYDFTTAQTTFVLSKLGKQGQKRIAMIVEGEWWENEARANFNYTGGYGTRDFRFMVMPQIEGQVDESVRSLGAADISTDFVVNAKSDKLDLCRLWIQFSHSESAMQTFTVNTGAVQNAYKYALTSEQYNSLTKFGKNVYDIKTKSGDYANVNLVYPTSYTASHAFADNTAMGGFTKCISSLVMGSYGSWDAIGTYLCSYFGKYADINGNRYVSAETFIEEMHKYYSQITWEQAYRQFQINGA